MGLGKSDIHFFMGTFWSIELHKPNNASGYIINTNTEPTLNDGFAPNSHGSILGRGTTFLLAIYFGIICREHIELTYF
jgi:hypothetical protein